MRLVGLGVRARNAVVGVEQVRDGAKRNKIVYAIVASDASQNSLKKLVPLLNARRVRFIEVPSAAELGAAVGRDSTAAPRSAADGTSINLTRRAFSSGTSFFKLFCDASLATIAYTILLRFAPSRTCSTPTTAFRARTPRPTRRMMRCRES